MTGGSKPWYLSMRNPLTHISYGPYVLFPILASAVWLAEVLGLLGLWVASGKPRYRSDEATIVFISDVGAVHQKYFIGMSVVTSAFYICSLFAERWLRHVDRLPADLRPRETVFDWLAIACCVIASAGLILCSAFNAFTHSDVHWSCALIFVVFTAISAIFQSAEVWSLHKDHPDRASLLRNSIYKLIVVTVAVVAAIAFGVTYGICHGNGYAYKSHSAATCNKVTGASAALEWTIAFILFFYFLTLIADLWPAGKSSARYMRRLARWQEKHGEGDDFTGRKAFGVFPERWQSRARAREEAMKKEMFERNHGHRAVNGETRQSEASTTPFNRQNGQV